jgi:hypothetical protein
MRVPGRIGILSLFFIGCGTSNGGADGGMPDVAVADAGSKDAAPEDLGPPDVFMPAPHQLFPQLPSGSGQVLSPLRLVTLSDPSDTESTRLVSFGAALVNSRWFAAVSQSYGLGAGTALGVQGSTIAPDAVFDRAAIQAYIDQAIQTNGAAAPDGHTVYALYLPDGPVLKFEDGSLNTGCSGLFGYHQTYGTMGDAFAVMQRCSPPRQETAEDFLTEVASHEIIEAATDPALMSWTLGTAPASRADASLWLSLPENGDLCEHTRWSEGGFSYQRIFDDHAASKGGDPCIPALAVPYFSTTSTGGWYRASPGRTVSVRLTGWSTAPVKSWFIRGIVFGESEQGFRVRVSSSTSATIQGVKVPTTNNGLTSTVSIQVPGSASSGSWGIAEIDSYRRDAQDGVLPGEDLYHLWLVGVYVP